MGGIDADGLLPVYHAAPRACPLHDRAPGVGQRRAATVSTAASAIARTAPVPGLSPEQQLLLERTADGSKRLGTVTRIAARTLATRQREAGGRRVEQVNPFPRVALKWAAALLRECDQPHHGVNLFGRDFFLLGKLLVTLGALRVLGVCSWLGLLVDQRMPAAAWASPTAPACSPIPGAFLEASTNSHEVVTLAAATLELVRAEAVHRHAEPYVRRAALLAGAQVGAHRGLLCLSALPTRPGCVLQPVATCVPALLSLPLSLRSRSWLLSRRHASPQPCSGLPLGLLRPPAWTEQRLRL